MVKPQHEDARIATKRRNRSFPGGKWMMIALALLLVLIALFAVVFI